ncbi:phage tail protein [Pseudomonas syringae]|uniref:Tail fiber protein n=1 Tax=Pseudomonas syringae pv. actinidiae TaxID=103796 RepID=A0A7Z6XY03_PSESF|nr:phage tail protein [Pseudomonas syringae]RMP81251.1 Tail fiber protein [Pseudomonas syringae pv. actinidiae]
MGASITFAGADLIAQKVAAKQTLNVARFIFANVPGLDASLPVDRSAAKPPAAQIVYVHDLAEDNAGYVNPNQVVYSAQIGSDIGDWDFNWIGLETDGGVLFAASSVALQQKRRNIPPMQVGNNLTRNFLVAFDGAQALTGITIDASTWQHDFTVRLGGIDERERLSNRDMFGRACFFGSSLQLEKVNDVFQAKAGRAFVEGIRIEGSVSLPVVLPALPTSVWLDVALQRELNDVVSSWQIVAGADKADYQDSAFTRHYCVPIADISAAGVITDRRPSEPISDALVRHFAARNGDYEHLRARATTKVDVGLGNLPNAKSDALEDNDSEVLATSKAVSSLYKSICIQVSSLTQGKTLTAAQRGLVVADATAASFAVTLPAADASLGVVDFVVRRADNSANRLVVQAAPGDRIKFHTHLNAVGYPFLVLMGSGDWWHLRSDGAGNWWPIGRLDATPVGRPVVETTSIFQPGGYGALNGALFQRAEWPWLWDHAQKSGLLVTESARGGMEGGWTTGDGAQTFRVPEARAEWLRILDEGRGIDSGRRAGSTQAGAVVDHYHNVTYLVGNQLPTGNQTGNGILSTFTSTPPVNFANVSNGVGNVSNGASSENRVRNIAYPGRLKLI